MKKLFLFFTVVITLQSCAQSTADSYGKKVFEAFQSKNLENIGMMPMNLFEEYAKIVILDEASETIEEMRPDYIRGLKENQKYLKEILKEGEEQGIQWNSIQLDSINIIDLSDSINMISDKIVCRSIDVYIHNDQQPFIIKIKKALMFKGSWYLGGSSVGGLVLEKQ